MIYIASFVLIVLLAKLSDNGKSRESDSERRVSALLYLLMTSILVLIMGFRYGIGTDYFQYESAFTWGGGEFRGLLLNVIRDFFVQNGVGFEVFIFTSALFIVGCFAYAIWTRSIYHVQPIAIYLLAGFYFSAFNGIRQSIAISIIFLGLKLLDNRKLGRYLILVCIAALFHSSALAAAVLIPCRFIKLTKKRMLGSLAVCCVVGVCTAGALLALAQFTEYSYYLGYDKFLGGNISLADTALILLSLALCYRLLPTSPQDKFSDLVNIRAWMLIVAFLFCVLSSQQFIFSRFIGLFSIAMIDLNPIALGVWAKDKAGALVVLLYWVVLLASCYARYWVLGIDEVVPYQTFLLR